jgi:8-amino-7-oxononanoate synthase
VAELGLEGQVQLRMATLGKAVGAYGAFVAGCSQLADYLMNRARTFIYSTALPVPVVAAALAGVELVSSEEGERRRRELRRASGELRQGLLAQGWPILEEVPGPILPLYVGDPRRAVILAERLLERGVLVRAMRHPTVPRGSERLRLVASAALDPRHTREALAAFAAVREEGAGR